MLILLLLLGLLFVVTLSIHLFQKNKNKDKKTHLEATECCGLHEVCDKFKKEKTNVIVYFEDEDLDAFIGKMATEYTQQDIALFHDVYSTLQENEIEEWKKSLKARNIQLPLSIQEGKND